MYINIQNKKIGFGMDKQHQLSSHIDKFEIQPINYRDHSRGLCLNEGHRRRTSSRDFQTKWCTRDERSSRHVKTQR